MEKIWLGRYPSGVPAEIALDDDATITALAGVICHRFSALPAFSNLHTTISFERLNALSSAFAGYLGGVLGLRPGERVALMMPNLLQYPIALLGVLRAGCVVVNTNPLYTERELAYQLNDSGAVAVVVLDNLAHTLQAVLPTTGVRHVITTRVGDMLPFPRAQIVNLVVKHVRHMVPDWHIPGAVSFSEALRKGQAAGWQFPRAAPDDLAFLQYTGGTTGVPKGAMLTHRNVVANLEQTAAWVTGVLDEGRETAIIPLPLYHIFALTTTLAFFRLGAHNVLITNPRDMPAFVKELRHERFSAMIGVNTMFNALLDAPGIERTNLRGAKVIVAGGMAVQRSVAQRWYQQFGVPLIEGYGLTEAAPIVAANPLTIGEYTGTVGLPVPSTEVDIRDDAGNPLPMGQAGELCVRGPQVMEGYWNKPDETANVFLPGDWLRTGDIAYMTEKGEIKLVDRKKDVIIVSGFKVFPNEVEDVAAMHAGVLEAAAIPEEDERSGQAVKIVVVRRDPGLSEEALIEHCRKHLTGYKVPKHVRFRQEPLPKSNIGKVLRRVVKEEEDRAAAASMRGSQAEPV